MESSKINDTDHDFFIPPLIEPNPIGTIELVENLPFVIAKYYSKILVWCYNNLFFHLDCSQKIISLAYYSACKQLFYTLDNDTKFELKSFINVASASIKLPNNMSKSISIIGNFNSSYGSMVIKHPVVTFKRWLIAGLGHDPERPPELNAHTDFREPHKLVWDDAASKELVDDLCLKYIASKNQNFFIDRKDGGRIMVSLPKITKENCYEWVHNIIIELPFAAELMLVGWLYGLPIHEWSDCSDKPKLFKSLDVVGCNMCKLRDSYISNCFDKSMILYEGGQVQKIIHHTFSISTFSPTRSGSPAQTIRSTRSHEVTWQFPMDDTSTLNIGFMLSPCKSMTFNTHFRTYSRKSRGETSYIDAKQDLNELHWSLV